MLRLLTALILLINIQGNAQFERDDKMLSIGYTNMLLQDDVYNEINLNFETQLNKWVSFHYSIGLGQRLYEDELHFHFSGGPVVSGFIFNNFANFINTFDDVVWMFFAGAASVLLPEKVSLNTYLWDETVRISPYVRALSFDYTRSTSGEPMKLVYRFGGGIDLSYTPKYSQTFFGCGVGYGSMYKLDHGLSLSARVGRFFNTKRRPKIDKEVDLGYD